MDPDGTNQRRLTQSAGSDQNPDWSPDGSQLVFHSRRHRNWDLYSIMPDGAGLNRITSGASTDWAPAWSPDGTQIAFAVANYANNREDVAVLDLKSSVVVRFVISDTFDLEPDWQPVR